MKLPGALGLIAGLWFWLAAGTVMAETNMVRLAVGPFYSPPGNEPLQKAAQLLPDLLTVSLSGQSQFQLVERQKISEVWRELNLTRNGMSSADSMLRLGRVLACDEFISGELVATKTNAQVWITVIDTRSGILTDLVLLPVDPGHYEPTLQAIAAFLDRSRARAPQKFIALGRFLDMSLSSAHEDWSRRLRTLIAKHFLEAGYGVVDNETVSPIFEEFQLDQAGLREAQSQRVKFQPSFWLIDARCKWVRDAEDKLSVAIRVRKMGEGETILQFRMPPGAELESNILSGLAKSLTAGNQGSPDMAAQEEAKLFGQEVNEAARGKTLLGPDRYATNNAGLDDRQYFQKKMEGLKQEGEKAAQRALLMDTNNLKAKLMVAGAYFGNTNDPAAQERGQHMLEELMTCTNTQIAFQSYYLLAHGMEQLGPKGMTLVVKPVRAIDRDYETEHERQIKQRSLKASEARYAANTNDLSAKYYLASAYFTDFENATNRQRGARMLEELYVGRDFYFATEASNDLVNGIHASDGKGSNTLFKAAVPPAATNFMAGAKKIAAPDQIIPKRPTFVVVDSFSAWPFCVAEDDGWLISQGTKLFFYDLQGSKTEVACPAKHKITALAADKDFWWIGTEGDGLMRIPKAGGAPKIWTEAEGLLMPTVTALCRSGGRLWVGFGFHGSGGLGYMDLKTGKFSGLQGNADFGATTAGGYVPQDSPVTFIQPANGKSVWAYSRKGMQQYDSESGQVTRTIPVYFDAAGVNTNFLATSARSGNSHDDIGGVKLCNLVNGRWDKVDFSQDPIENDVNAICLDGKNLWAGGTSTSDEADNFIKLVDMPSAKVIGRYAFKGTGYIYWIGTKGEQVWFLAGWGGSGVKLYRFSK